MATQKREIVFTPPSGTGELLFRRMQAREELGRLPEYTVELLRLSKDAKVIRASSLLGKVATVSMMLDDDSLRHFNGHIVRFVQGATRGRFDVFHAELRPWLWFLTRTSNSKIFQPDKTVVDIVKAVFAGYAGHSVENKLTATYRPRAFRVQYRESDFNFVSRLMEEEGIYYYFKHTASGHTMVLCDGLSGHEPIEGGELVNAESTDNLTVNHAWDWRRIDTIQSLKYAHGDHDFQTPTTVLTTTASVAVSGMSDKPADLEVFDYPGGYDDPHVKEAAGSKDQGTAWAKLRADDFAARQAVSSGLSMYRPVAVGLTFDLTEHAQKGPYLVTTADYELDLGDAEGRSDQDAGPMFKCRFEAIPKNTRFVSQRLTERPFVHGLQTAVVVGKKGDDIHTDEYGRVKVKFRWDRIGTADENGSCWIRVVHPWAGPGFGMVALPRIGHEVVVSFVDGDPDRPIITGSVYNGINRSAYKLPEHATVSGIKTRSSKGGKVDTANEIRFEDEKGKEYIWFQAEKDYFRLVKNDAFDFVKKNETLKVELTRKEVIGENWYVDVGKDVMHNLGKDLHVKVAADIFLTGGATYQVQIAKDLSVKVGGDAGIAIGNSADIKSGGDMAVYSDGVMHLKAAQNLLQQAGQKLSLKAGMSISMEAGMTITLKAGPSFISIGPGGVDISGPMVKINSGGSGGAATAVKAASPTAPAEAKKQDELIAAKKTDYEKNFADPLPAD